MIMYQSSHPKIIPLWLYCCILGCCVTRQSWQPHVRRCRRCRRDCRSQSGSDEYSSAGRAFAWSQCMCGKRKHHRNEDCGKKTEKKKTQTLSTWKKPWICESSSAKTHCTVGTQCSCGLSDGLLVTSMGLPLHVRKGKINQRHGLHSQKNLQQAF